MIMKNGSSLTIQSTGENMKNSYSIMVKSVGDLIRMGVWYSDACEVIMRLIPSTEIKTMRGPVSSDEWWDTFEDSVNLYLYNKHVPKPNYKTIY